jgi:hypothetical protein
MRLAVLVCLTAAAASPQSAPVPDPQTDHQQAIVERIRKKALHYVQDLPNFMCTQVTARHIDSSGTAEKWKPLDTIEEDLNYFDHHETYKIVSINGRPAPRGVTHNGLKNLQSSGEFGSLLRWQIFGERSHAEFKWERLDTLRGRPVQVLSYRVARENSSWSIRRNNLATITAYHGLIFADSATDSILRATVINEMPDGFPVHEAGMEIDYDFTDISGHKYLLPVVSISEVRIGKTLHKNTIRFSKYRKFASDTEIKFDVATPSGGRAPGPAPDPLVRQ